jgi:hypothetical protein
MSETKKHGASTLLSIARSTSSLVYSEQLTSENSVTRQTHEQSTCA